MKLPVNPSVSEIENSNCLAYSQLLKISDDVTIPDPFSLCSGWCSERAAIHSWPPVYLSDITTFFIKHCPDTTTDHFLNEYKVGKAFEYFSSEWLKEIFYQKLNNDFCPLRAACTPSQRLSHSDHKVWVCVNQTTGKIMSAYCSCTAGLGQTCNHVAGLLFRLEQANRMGLSNPACTSLPCSWKVPNETVNYGPKLISEMNVKKSRHGKSDKARPLVSSTKRNYQPLPEPGVANPLQSIGKALEKILPDACLYKGFIVNQDETLTSRQNKTTKPVEHVECLQTKEGETQVACNKYSIANYAQQFKPGQSDEFFATFPRLNGKEIKELAEKTKTQSSSTLWHEARKARITASRFYAVHTKVQTITANSNGTNVDASPLLRSLLGETGLSDQDKLPHAVKHGKNMEPSAKKDYFLQNKKKHQNLELKECGLVLHEDYQFLGASPDGLISCDCCGEGVLEIKCPLVSPCDICNPNLCTCLDKTVAYLKRENGLLKLKNNHMYYGQIQGQMAITGRGYCDFVVYSPFAVHQERISFNSEFWKQILHNLIYFYKQYMVPYIIESRFTKGNNTQATIQAEPMEVDTCMPSNCVEPVYFCPACNNRVKEQENVTSFGERSVCCDTCNKWFHFKCVKMTKSLLKSSEFWYCSDCK